LLRKKVKGRYVLGAEMEERKVSEKFR